MNNQANLTPGIPMGHQMLANQEELAKFMSQYQQKAGGGANFNGGALPSPYMNDQGSGMGGKGQRLDSEGSDDESDSQGGSGKAKNKRRSKNDVDGRDFKCKYCDKTYLSYPALYTHMKQKHSKGPDGEVRTPPTSGRGRGRPRKNPYQRTDPKSDEYFNAPERKGGPIDPLMHFESVYDQLFKGDKQYKSHTDYPIYKYLVQFSSKQETKSGKGAQQHDADSKGEEFKADDGTSKKSWKKNYDNLSDTDRQSMLVDEIFAYYLYKISLKVNESFYKTVLMYTILFRECLNEIGWQKKIESEGIKIEDEPELKQKMETQQYCLHNNAEHAPEICNEFVTVFMEHKRNQFDISKPDQIDLTINLCHWLFENQFTCSKLTMIS